MAADNESLREMLRSFIAQQTEFNEYQRMINAAAQARLNGIQDELTEFKDQTNAKFAEVNAKFAEVNAKFAEVSAEFAEVNAKFAGADARFQGLANDAAEVKGGHAYIMTIQRPGVVAERLEFYYDRVITAGELVDMTRELPEVIPNDSERESFLNADLVLKVKDKVNMLTNYIAVEISYTGQERDSQRALRNAGFLRQFTGRPARAAVASVKNDVVTQAYIESAELLWYRIRAADSQPS